MLSSGIALFLLFHLEVTKEKCIFAKNSRRLNKKNMKKMATTLNPTQIHLLRMFSADNTEKGLQELKEVLFKYYYEKMNKSLDELWNSGVLNQERLDKIANMDLHKL